MAESYFQGLFAVNVTWQPYHSFCSCRTCCLFSFCLHDVSKMWLHSNPLRPANYKCQESSVVMYMSHNNFSTLPSRWLNLYVVFLSLKQHLCHHFFFLHGGLHLGRSGRWNLEHVLKATVFHDGSLGNCKRLRISTFVRRR